MHFCLLEQVVFAFVKITSKTLSWFQLNAMCPGKEFLSNDVILTTALGGRGTDFAVNDDVHASGGLFVLLTHLAPNRYKLRGMLFI